MLLIRFLLMVKLEFFAFFPWAVRVLVVFLRRRVSDRFSLWIFTALIVSDYILERILGALHATCNRCFACSLRTKSLVAAYFRLGLILSLPTFLVLLIWGSITLDVPSLIHHKSEIVLVVYACRNVGVILNEFIQSNNSVWLVRQMQFESGQELLENLSLSFAAILHGWVLFRVIDFHDVSVINLPAAVFVQFLECLLHQSESPLIQFAPNNSQELVVLDSSVAISVKCFKKSSNIKVRQFDLWLNHSLGKLRQIKSSVSVVVHDPKNACNSDDRLGSA